MKGIGLYMQTYYSKIVHIITNALGSSEIEFDWNNFGVKIFQLKQCNVLKSGTDEMLQHFNTLIRLTLITKRGSCFIWTGFQRLNIAVGTVVY